MAEERIEKPEKDEESEIDIVELASTLWANKKTLIKWSFIGAVFALVIAFSIPREYTTSVNLAPEINDNKANGGNLGALASMSGINFGSAGGSDAVYPMLYPDVVSSVPFITSLFDVVIKTSDEDGKSMTVQEYLEDDIRSPWWSYIFGLPGEIIGLFVSEDEEDADHKLDSFQLTLPESLMVTALNDRIKTNFDMKTGVVTIDVTMQDPLVSAMLADTVVSRLKDYITDYRTNKARKDLEYALKLNQEAKANYYEAQQRYADYLDRNQGLAFHSAQTIRERLSNEASLAFSLYNQTSQQVNSARAKVQEVTPVYAVITPATVPIKPSSPHKFRILIGFTFLAFVICAGCILFKTHFMQSYQEKFKSFGTHSEQDKTETKKE